MDEFLFGTKLVAAFFDVSARAIQQWAQAGLPRVKHGIYNLKECHQWWLHNIADVKADGGSDSMNVIKIDYWKAKAEAVRIQVDQLMGKLITREEVNRQWARRLNVLFAGLHELQNRLPPLLEGLDVKQMRPLITEEIKLLQTALIEPGVFYPPTEIKEAKKCKVKKKAKRRLKKSTKKSSASTRKSRKSTAKSKS